MINESPPFMGLNIRIPIIIPIKGQGFINHGSGLQLRKGGSKYSLYSLKRGYIGDYIRGY